MGCIQTKKLGDNEIIKVNYPENQISNTTNLKISKKFSLFLKKRENLFIFNFEI